MSTAGETLDSVAQAVREAGTGIRDQQPQIAEFAETAASQVERAAEYLRVHDANDLIDEASRFARQQPMVVVGGALLAGLALGRLLKSSTTQSSGYGAYGRYGSSPAYGAGYGAGGAYNGSSGRYGASDGFGTGDRYGTAFGGDTGYATGGTSDISGTTGSDSDMTDDTTRTAGGLGTSER
jgi:ElaB/YqjD/DUF883 family membrane-anchored ribosome-binding protein